MQHDHSIPLESQQIQLLWLILSLRFILFWVELAIGLTSHSISLLASAGHLFLDLVTLGLTVLAVYLAQRQATLNYQKISAWVGLLNGMILCAIAVFLATEALNHLKSPQIVSGVPMLVGAFLSLSLNGWSSYQLHEDSKDNLNVRGVFLHGMADAAISVSVMLAALAVYFFHWFWADAVGSLSVAALIAISALLLIKDSWLTLID